MNATEENNVSGWLGLQDGRVLGFVMKTGADVDDAARACGRAAARQGKVGPLRLFAPDRVAEALGISEPEAARLVGTTIMHFGAEDDFTRLLMLSTDVANAARVGVDEAIRVRRSVAPRFAPAGAVGAK